MALPALKDLLPDHIFYNYNSTSASTTRPPPPPPPPPSPPLYSYLQAGPSSKLNSSVPVSSSSYSSVQPPHPGTSVGTAPPQPRYPYPHSTSVREGQASPDANGGAAFDSRRFHSRHPEINMESSAALDDRHASEVRSRSRSLGLSASADLGDDDDGRREQDGANIGATSNNADDDRTKKHICPTCKKSFNRPSSLKIHMNTHTGVKPYACPYPGCGRVFNVSSNMRRHYRNHANRVPPAPLPIPFTSTLPPLINVPPHAPPRPAPSSGVYGPALPYEQTWAIHGQTTQRHEQERTCMYAGDHLPPALVDSVALYGGTAGDDGRGYDRVYGSRRGNGSGRVDYADNAAALRERGYPEHLPSEAVRDGRHYYDAHPSSRPEHAPNPTSIRATYPEPTREYHDAPLDFYPSTHYPYPYPYPVHHNSTTTAAYTNNSNSRSGDAYPCASTAHRCSTSSGGLSFDLRPAGSGAGGAGAGVPPTPPYTNEAALSPPAYAHPLVQSQPHSLPHPSGSPTESVPPLPFDSFAVPTAGNSRLGMRRAQGEEDEREQELDDSDPHVNGSWEGYIGRMREGDWTWRDRDERDDAKQNEILRELLDPETGLKATYDALAHIVSGSRARETSRSTPVSGESGWNEDAKVCGVGKALGRTSTCPLGAPGDARQQPSPDTPSLLVCALHEEERSVPVSDSSVDAPEKLQDGNEGEKEKEARTRPTHTRRESLQIASIMNPTEEPPSSKAQAHEESRCATKRTTLANAVLDGGKAVTSDSSSANAASENTKKPTREVGKTPGAAPPPPYPLLKRPLEKMLELDEEDERGESLPVSIRAKSTEGKGGRRTKRRKRR